MSDQGFELIGTGLSVFLGDQAVEGPVVWLDTPAAVIDFVSRDSVADSIVLARGGTTTFLTPALTAGVKGVVTLQGHPESHLGILSREYGIPCVMGVGFTAGIQSDRGETIPPAGAILRLDTTAAEGQVLIEEGADLQPAPAADPDDAAAAAAQMEQIQLLLTKYRGEIPHGSEGDKEIRSGFKTGVMDLTRENVGGDLAVDEANELMEYMGWNGWDFLAQRATEGESGLIPRQEYETLGCVNAWQRWPEFFELITDAVGIDGLIEIGGTSRREVGSKANLLHTWCTGFIPSFGRGVLVDLGIESPEAGDVRLRGALQFMRRLYMGIWDGGPMLTSMRDYKAPLLDDEWITRFQDEGSGIADPEERSLLQKFNATTELMGFLLHFDNRSGLADSGPYPLPGGGFMIVRDHFLNDPMYHWHDVAEGLPHAITQAMVFEPDEEIELALMDGATLFTKPANYLKHLKSMSVYVRDTKDTPISDLRKADHAEMEQIIARCDEGSSRLYRRIASMPKRDKIMAGAQVYYAEFVAPFARLAGVWDQMVDEHDFFELDPVTSQAYYKLIAGGAAAEMMPRLFLMGTGNPPLQGEPDVDTEAVYPALHRLALRGSLPEVDGAAELEGAGLIVSTPAGALLSEQGHALHGRLLDQERAALDLDQLGSIYERFLAANSPMKDASSRWQTLAEDDDARFELLGELGDLVERVQPVLSRTAETVPRFADHRTRLEEAFAKAEEGDHEYVTAPGVESVHTVWMEIHEDYLQTLGRSREEEGSY